MARNTSNKGGTVERAARALLESKGYLVDKTTRSPIVRWLPNSETGKMEQKILGSHANDFFGAFDLIAVHPSKGIRFIQVTTTGHVGERKAKCELVIRRFPSSVFCEVWGWVGGARRIDKRPTVVTPDNPAGRRYLRRMYWRRFVWRRDQWIDATNPLDGWIDGWVPPQVRAVEAERRAARTGAA